MNIERFHNELAMRLGYERIVNDRRILIYVEESEEPLVTLKIEGGDDICFRVTDHLKETYVQTTSEIKEIMDAVHQAYLNANKSVFNEIII